MRGVGGRVELVGAEHAVEVGDRAHAATAVGVDGVTVGPTVLRLVAVEHELLPSTGESTWSAIVVERRLLDDVPLEELAVPGDERVVVVVGPTAHFSHQYGECSAWARWLPCDSSPAVRSFAASSVFE